MLGEKKRDLVEFPTVDLVGASQNAKGLTIGRMSRLEVRVTVYYIFSGDLIQPWGSESHQL